MTFLRRMYHSLSLAIWHRQIVSMKTLRSAEAGARPLLCTQIQITVTAPCLQKTLSQEKMHMVFSIGIQCASSFGPGCRAGSLSQDEEMQSAGSVREQTAKYSFCAHVRAKRQACSDRAL